MLPHCDELFERFFDRWYDDEWRRWKGFKATRPDIQRQEAYIGKAATDVSPLNAKGQTGVAEMVRKIFESALHDWIGYLEVSTPVDLAWVDAWDHFYDRQQISEIIEDADPANFGNGYLVSCCQFGAVLGVVLRDQNKQLEWLYAWPYWESSLLHPPTGTVIPVFHWAIKKMSEYGVDDGFAAKIKACCNLLEQQSSGDRG